MRWSSPIALLRDGDLVDLRCRPAHEWGRHVRADRA
jgi:hypothetical protein